MREIKFRVWNKQNAQFYYSGIINGAFGFFKPIDKESPDIAESVLPDYNYMQQFTGLKDKNDKYIYEGDIVKVDFCKCGLQVCKVEWGTMGFEFYLIADNGEVSFPTIIKDFPLSCEIIGNIFETPEFLHEQKTG